MTNRTVKQRTNEIFILIEQELLEDFLYPASRIMANYNRTGELISAVADPICTTSASVVAALDLLVALSADCIANLKLLTSMLTEMFSGGKYRYFVSINNRW